MADIKSALEIALEKAEKLGEATAEEKLEWKYVPEGEKLASRYIKGDASLTVEMGKYEADVKKYVMAGTQEILFRQINLPENELAKKNNKRAMDGVKELKSDKVAVENVFSRIRRIFDHYAEQGEQQRRQAHESLKEQMAARFQEALQRQTGSANAMKIDVERQPQFQEEWRKTLSQLDSQYIKLLKEYKQELAVIA